MYMWQVVNRTKELYIQEAQLTDRSVIIWRIDMAGSIFNLDGNAFHGSTRGLIHPSHILMLHELPEEEDAVVNPQELSRELPPGTS